MKYNFTTLFLIITLAAYSQDKTPFKEMTADLPDETEETTLLNKKEVQLEAAYMYDHFSKGTDPQIYQGLLRYGLLTNVEIRLLAEDGYARDKYIEETVQATSPLSLGAKVSLIKDRKILPDITLVAYLKLPLTSHTKEQTLYWSPNISLTFQNKLGDKWVLDYNGGVQQESFNNTWQYFANASLHFKATEKLELFGEYYGQFTQQEEPYHNAGLGIFYQISNNYGIFTTFGRSIEHDPENMFISSGLVIRY